MRAFLKIVIAKAFGILLWVYAVFQLLLDWVGRSTFGEDWKQLQEDTMPEVLVWLFKSPWWVAPLIAIAMSCWIIYFTWPEKQKLASDIDLEGPQAKKLGRRYVGDLTLDAFLVRRDDAPEKIWLNWTSPVSSSVIKIGLDVTDEGKGNQWMLISEFPSAIKGQEITTLLCVSDEDGKWLWASKHPIALPWKGTKCYFTVEDLKGNKWRWGFAAAPRSDASENPNFVGDNIYYMN